LTEPKECIDSLTELGLTDLEARIYILLLKQSPLSGYGVAKILGRSVPNIYKTLSAMSQKGLVMSTLEKTTNIFVPTPLEEYLKQYCRRSEALADRARSTIEQMDLDEDQTRQSLYTLENTGQVIGKTIGMIEKAEVSISISADRFPLLQLSAYLSEASRRGVNVLINSYLPLEVPDCDVVYWQRRKERKSWPGNLLIAAVDGREMVTAFFSFEEKVIDAFWVNNSYLVTTFHHGRSADTLLALILNLLKKDISIEDLRNSIMTLTEKHIFGIPHSTMYDSLLSESIKNQK